MRDLILVTWTHARPGRIEFIRRHIRTFISQIERYHWIVIEDGDRPDPEVQAILAGCNSHYLHIGPTRDNGHAQRNFAFEYIRDRGLDGIVYNLDDHNLAKPELAAELRRITKVAIVPLGNLGPNNVERPIISNGRFVRWDGGWLERKYPVAAGGFAFDSRLIFNVPSPIWNWRGIGGESEFIDRLVGSIDELDFSPCHWNQVCLAFNKEPLSQPVPVADPPPRRESVERAPEIDPIRLYEHQPSAAEYAPAGDPRPRLALVGCGWFACEAHIPALQRLERDRLVQVDALCSRSEQSLARASRQLGPRTLKQYRTMEAAFADPDIDIVDLVLPIGLMPGAIRAALRAGKHVISEKPCAPSVATCADLLRECGEFERPPFWAVAENWRFKNTTRLVEQIVKSGRLGSIHLVDFQFITSSSPQFYSGWRGSPDYQGGHLLDVGVHFIALLRQVVGEVDRVSARVSQRRPHLPPADSVTAVMTFANGAQGSFQLSFAASPQDARPALLTLIGSHGSLHVDFFRGAVRLRDSARERVVGVPDDPWVQGGVYQTLAHCLGALRHHAPLRSSPEQGLSDLAVIEAMLLSSETDKPVSPSSLYPALHATGRTLATFNGIWDFKPKHVVECGSIAEVSRSVTAAASAGLRVRTMGLGNSWGRELLTSDVCIGLSGLNRIHGVDTKRRTVSLDGGVRLGDLTRVLAAQGLCLPSLPFNPNVTVGGAVSTATHGTSPKWGTLSDFVASLKLVVASGEVMEIGPAAQPPDLRAARAAVGLLGVVVELELELIPLPWVRLFELTMELPAFLAQAPAILSRYEHVWGHWTLGEDKIQLECMETRTLPETGFHPYVSGDTGSWASLRKSPPPASAITVTRGNARQVWMSMQYGVALTRLETAVGHIQQSHFARNNAGRVVEVKFLQGNDRTFLGPNSRHDSVLFNIWWRVDEDIKFEVLADFESSMRELDARPHWGKFHRLPDLEYMQRAYSSWQEFAAIRSRVDPAGVFSIFPECRG
jgi:L-gulono-1,4-lactone dehydrogenase